MILLPKRRSYLAQTMALSQNFQNSNTNRTRSTTRNVKNTNCSSKDATTVVFHMPHKEFKKR